MSGSRVPSHPMTIDARLFGGGIAGAVGEPLRAGEPRPRRHVLNDLARSRPRARRDNRRGPHRSVSRADRRRTVDPPQILDRAASRRGCRDCSTASGSHGTGAGCREGQRTCAAVRGPLANPREASGPPRGCDGVAAGRCAHRGRPVEPNANPTAICVTPTNGRSTFSSPCSLGRGVAMKYRDRLTKAAAGWVDLLPIKMVHRAG